jgi:hypothetical protein
MYALLEIGSAVAHITCTLATAAAAAAAAAASMLWCCEVDAHNTAT